MLAGERRRVAALRLGARDRGAAQLLELLCRESGLAQHLGHQAQRRNQVLALHLDARAVAADRDAGVQPVEGVLDLRAAQLMRAAHQHAPGEAARHFAVHEALLVAPVQCEVGHHAAAAGLLGQQRGADAVGQRAPDHARLDVLRRGIEGLTKAHALAALVAGERGLQVGRRRDLRALGAFGRHEHSEHAVGRLEKLLGDALHVLERDLAQPVAIQEEQAPVADRGKLRKGAHERRGLEFAFLEVVQQPGAGPLDFLGGDLVPAQIFDHLEQRATRRLELAVLGQRGAEIDEARVVQPALAAPDGAGKAFLHQRAVQAPGGHLAEQAGEHIDRRVVGMAARRHAVQRVHDLVVADAPQGDVALAVLRRLLRIENRQLAGGLRNRPELPADELERARLLEAPGDDEQRVVGLVPGAVEGLQPVDRHLLDIRARADDRVAVVVPGEGELLHALEQHAAGVVLARLELVAHHRHLAVEIALAHERVDHPVGLHPERPLEVVAARRKRLEVVGAVVGGGAVVAPAAARELLLDVGMALGALEQEVLEQVRHAFLAVAFVARADEVHDVHGDGVDPRVGQQQHAQAIGEPVLAHAFDGHHLLRKFQARSAQRHEPQQREGEEPFHSNQSKKCRARRPAAIVAKVARQRHATATATAPASRRSFSGPRASCPCCRRIYQTP
jgi:hypothetical protein